MISIPFRGSKRCSYKQVKKIVEENGYTRVLEPFGGSGVLSANLLNDGLIKEAVINDYDGMFELYPEFLDIKDAVVKECKEKGLVKSYKSKVNGQICNYKLDEHGNKEIIESEKLSLKEKAILRGAISKYDPKYYGLLATGDCFCHSGVQSSRSNGITLTNFMYFRRRLSTGHAREYLKVIDRCTLTHLDYRDFLKTVPVDKETLLIVDPPYIGADIGTYSNKSIFDYSKTSELIGLLKQAQADFVFFNYGMDQIKRLLSENGLEYKTIEYTGTASKTANRQSRDVIAYVRCL